jgi:hypothetical protein
MSELLRELTEAIKVRDGAQTEYTDFIKQYKVDLAERKKRLDDALKLVKEIELELVSPGAARPLLARSATPEPEEETADERQRGPTAPPRVIDVSNLPKPKRDRRPKTDRADRREAVISPNGPVRQLEAPVMPRETFKDHFEQMFVESARPVKPPAKSTPQRPGPMNQDAALLCALELPSVSAELGRLAAEGGTDDEIHRALIQWSGHYSAGSATSNPWACVGGSIPRFFYDTDCELRNKPGGNATLRDGLLVAAVRRLLHIRKPRPTAADGKPVRARKQTAAAGAVTA